MNKTTISLLVLLLILSLSGAAQKRLLNFDILRDGNKVGKILFSETSAANTDSLKMESTVNTKLFSTFIAEAKELAVFNNGILKESSIYRQLNGKEKANKKHRAGNGKYFITNGKNSTEMKIYPITYNMLSLYSSEPVNIQKVYSDNFESFLDIKKTGDHIYKITLPDNNYNYYLYKDGILNQVDVHHTLYSAKFVLVTQ